MHITVNYSYNYIISIVFEVADMSIDDVLAKLVEVIKSSQEFSRFKQAKAVISKYPDLKRELEELTLSQKQLYSGKLSEKETEAKINQLNKKLENLSKIPEIKNYFNASNALNQMITKFNSNLSECLEKSLQ
jgi:cell fate (sporulation/competence/biofilm development) regulator YlbF (YheA/YmcA/DUF963 family)